MKKLRWGVIGAGGIACHGDRAEGIDGGLNHDVGDGEEHALHAGRRDGPA